MNHISTSDIQSSHILNFVKLSPSENTTILVTDYVSPCNYVEVANKVMAYTHLNAEQVGFIQTSKENKAVLKMDMPAGEFCGDGTLAAAAMARWKKYTSKDQFSIETSGVNSSIQCKVKYIKGNMYKVKASMPTEYKLADYVTVFRNYKISGQLVTLSGISHLLLQRERNKYDLTLVAELAKQVALAVKTNAIGIIPYSRTGDGVRIEPCIHVPKTGKLLFERGCGSGSLAIGLYFAHKSKKSINMNIQQPGGVINVEINLLNSANRIPRIESAFLETDILVTCEGKVYI